MEMEMEDYGGIMSPAARRDSVKYRRTGENEKQKGEVRRQRLQERRHYDEMVVKARLLRHIKDP